MSVFWIIVNCSKKWQCVCFVFCFVKSTFCVSLFVLQPGGDVTTHYLVWALFCNKNAQPLENWEFSKVHIFKPSPFTRVWTERAELCPSSIWTEDNKSLIIHIKLYFKWLQTAWLAEWETSAYSTNEWTSNVSEKTQESTEEPSVSEPGELSFITGKNQKCGGGMQDYWGEMNGDFSWGKGSSLWWWIGGGLLSLYSVVIQSQPFHKSLPVSLV